VTVGVAVGVGVGGTGGLDAVLEDLPPGGHPGPVEVDDPPLEVPVPLELLVTAPEEPWDDVDKVDEEVPDVADEELVLELLLLPALSLLVELPPDLEEAADPEDWLESL
jgi:hypothetical protein